MKLNEKRDAALPFLGIGVLCLIGSFVMAGVVAAQIPLISWFASLFGGLAALAGLWMIGYSIWQALANSVHAGQRAIALRALPDVSPAIAAASEIFDGSRIPRLSKDTPEMSTKAWDHFDNQSALQGHVAYLNEIHAKVIGFLKPAPIRYAADQTRVENQQLALYRMAHQAAGVARKVEKSFPKLKADLAAVPQPKSVALPTPPKLESLKNLDQAHRNFAMASGRAIAQGATQGGVAGAVVAVVASVAIGVIAQQKQIRAMEEAHGSLGAFIGRAADDIGLLGLAHEELVDTSREVHRQSTELKALLLWAREADGQGKFKSGTILTTDDRAKVLNLTTYAMIARIEAAKAT